MANYRPLPGPRPGTADAITADSQRRRYESQQAQVIEAQERLNALRAAARIATSANRFGTLSTINATNALRTAQARSAQQR